MNILFLSVSTFTSVKERGIYSDLMRELRSRGHKIYIAAPAERRYGMPTTLIKEENVEILKIWTFNIQKTNLIEKGMGTLLIEYQFDRAIRRYWGDVNFNLVLYATPTITFNNVVDRVKKRCGSRSYLMLKDIFPQNAVDLGMLRKGGLMHSFFRRKERKLYRISDRIGCMSPANCRYVIEHNPEVDARKVELCPNSVEPVACEPQDAASRAKLLGKYGIPADKTLYIYGGNLGKPQGLDFLLDVVAANESSKIRHIVIVGNGTEYPRMRRWMDEHRPAHATLLSALDKADYDNLVKACHVGMIFLDPRFTIPNYPSRLLSYLENSMPVLMATDANTDVGTIAESEGYGLWSLNGDLPLFMSHMESLKDSHLRNTMGKKGLDYMLANYTAEKAADIIEASLK